VICLHRCAAGGEAEGICGDDGGGQEGGQGPEPGAASSRRGESQLGGRAGDGGHDVLCSGQGGGEAGLSGPWMTGGFCHGAHTAFAQAVVGPDKARDELGSRDAQTWSRVPLALLGIRDGTATRQS
jgi:hypothetical protein